VVSKLGKRQREGTLLLVSFFLPHPSPVSHFFVLQVLSQTILFHFLTDIAFLSSHLSVVSYISISIDPVPHLSISRRPRRIFQQIPYACHVFVLLNVVVGDLLVNPMALLRRITSAVRTFDHTTLAITHHPNGEGVYLSVENVRVKPSNR
jgi:hypothetical protein